MNECYRPNIFPRFFLSYILDGGRLLLVGVSLQIEMPIRRLGPNSPVPPSTHPPEALLRGEKWVLSKMDRSEKLPAKWIVLKANYAPDSVHLRNVWEVRRNNTIGVVGDSKQEVWGLWSERVWTEGIVSVSLCLSQSGNWTSFQLISMLISSPSPEMWWNYTD